MSNNGRGNKKYQEGICKKSNPKTKNIRLLLADGIEVYGKPGENINSIVVGPPGCGKTFSYMLSTILCEDECSMVIDDKKGTLYNKAADALREKGYLVLKMDFTDHTGNFKYNCFDNIRTQEDAMRFADFIVPTQGRNVDKYWEMSSKCLLRCLMEIARHQYQGALNLELFIELFNECGNKGDDEYDDDGNRIPDGVERIIEIHRAMGYKYDAMEEYKRIRSVPENTWNCTVNTLRGELMKYSSERLYSMTDKTTFDFIRMGKQPVAVFVISPDTEKSVYPLIQLMYQDMADSLIKYADKQCKKNDGRLPIHVRFLVDDFASGVQQVNFANLIANCRSRNISYMLGFQSIAQLKALYANSADSILDCVNYQIYYGTTNIDTNYHLARLMQRPVREIQQMNEETVCLIQRGKVPRFVKRIQTLSLPEYIRSVEDKDTSKKWTRESA